LILRHFIFTFLCLCLQSSIGQDISFKNINVSQGLSSNLVYEACQGPDGLLWIISNYKLDSYHNGKVINYTNANVPSIENYEFSEVIVDNENIVWLKTRTGQVLYLDKNRILKNAIESDPNTRILNFLKRENGQVHFISKKGQYRFNIRQNLIDTLFTFDKPIYERPALQINNEDEDSYLITSGRNVVLYDAKSGKTKFEYKGVYPYGAAMLDNEHMVVSTSKYNELFLINVKEGKIVKNLFEDIKIKYPKTNTYFRRVKRISPSQIGITSGYHGLFILDIAEMKFNNYVHDFSNPRSLSSNNSYMLFSSKNGDVYITTRTSGLNFFNLHSKNATHIRSFVDYDMNEIFEGHVSLVVKTKDGILYLSTARGLIKYDPKTKKAEFDALQNEDESFLSVSAMFIDDKNRLWFGIRGVGVWIMDLNGNVVHQFKYAPDFNEITLKSNLVTGITKGFDGNIWIGTAKGISRLNPQTLRFVDDHLSKEIDNFKKKVRILKTIGRVTFVGSRETGGFVFSVDGMSEVGGLLNSDIQDVTSFGKTHNDLLLQGTLDGVHISKYDKASNKYKFEKKILNGRILSIDKDNNGLLWIATEKILYKYDSKKGIISNYTSDEGFTGGGFRMLGSFKDHDGKLYYGMNTGLCSFDPLDIKKSEMGLNPTITGVNEGNFTFNITSDDEVTLSANNNNVGIYYLNYNIWNDKEIQYQYSISVNEPDWKTAITNPILIQNIKPGDYKVKLRASIDGSVWTDSSNTLTLFIDYPWWRSWWAYTLALIIFSVTTYFVYIFYTRIKADKVEKLMYDESLRYFSFSMHKYADMDLEFWDVTLRCLLQIKIDTCSIYLANDENNSFYRKAVKVNSVKDNDYLERPEWITNDKGIVGKVLKNCEPIIIGDLNKESDNIYNDHLRLSKITIPILSNNRLLGVIDCEQQSGDFFNDRRLAFILAISTIVATKIEAHKSEENRKNVEISLSNNLKKVSELEMKSLRSQMNPHFMFNSLNSINNFIVKNDQENASDYLTSFAQLMRIILENSRQDWVTLESELRALRLYVGMEKLRFENQFNYIETIGKSVDIISTMIPPMLIQPYIENAIWHGLLPKKSSKSILKLDFEQKNGFLFITIDDNGIGTKKSQEKKSSFKVSKKSFGLKIITERLDMINEIYNLEAKVQVIDKSDTSVLLSGTKVILSMKIKHKT
jgi:ligand-binding sensor domain-containing protein